jgi:hypothetical protein
MANFPMILFGTRADDEAKRELSTNEILGFAKKYNLEYWEGSSKTGENIHEAVKELVRQIILSTQNRKVNEYLSQKGPNAKVKKKEIEGKGVCNVQ